MKFKIILCFFISVSSLYGLTVDYGAGFSFAFTQDLLKADARICKQTFDPERWNYTNQTKSNKNYALGFFVQSGLKNSSWVNWGLEYNFLWINYQHLNSFNSTEQVGEEDEIEKIIDTSLTKNYQRELVQNNFDLYYRIDFLEKFVPISLQFNCGLSVRHALREKLHRQLIVTTLEDAKEDDDGKPNPPIITQTREQQDSLKFMSGTSLGLHLGMRLNVYLIFVALDYNFNPNSNIYYSHKNSLAYASKEQRQHAFSGTLGLIINRTMIDEWRKAK